MVGIDFGKPLFTTEEIQRKIHELGSRISADYADKDLLVVGVLNPPEPFQVRIGSDAVKQGHVIVDLGSLRLFPDPHRPGGLCRRRIPVGEKQNLEASHAGRRLEHQASARHRMERGRIKTLRPGSFA